MIGGMRCAWLVTCLFGCYTSSAPAPAPIVASAPPAAPPPPTCEATALHLRDVYAPEGTGEAAHAASLARCDADHWGDQARRCIARADKVLDLQPCFDQLTEAQASAFTTELAHAVHDDDGLPPACRRYGQAIEKLASCSKLPAEARAALRESFQQSVDAWASVPPEGRDALEAACQAAVDAVEQSSVACD